MDNDVQIGFQGSRFGEERANGDIDAVVRWSLNLWRNHKKYLRDRENRHRVMGDLLVNAPDCRYIVASTAINLTEVGDCLGLDALKRATEACLLLVVASPFPSFGLMKHTIVHTVLQLRNGKLRDLVAQKLCSGEGIGGVMSATLFAAWRSFVPELDAPAKSPAAESNNKTDRLAGLAALDGQSADSQLDVFQTIFPSYQTFRLLQSIIMLTTDSVLVTGDLESISSAMIAMVSLVAPMSCQHEVLFNVDIDEAIALLLRAEGDSSKDQRGFIIGISSRDIPRLILASLTRSRRDCAHSWWVADTRNGTVARVAASSLPPSQILIPAADRVKDAYRRNVPLNDLHHGLLETAAATFGAYRRYLHLTSSGKEIHLLRLLGQTVGGGSEPSSNQQLHAVSFGTALAVSPVWMNFQQALIEVEGDAALKQKFITALRSPTTAVPVNPTVSLRHANVINFLVRASKRFPEHFADELAAAGRPLPKDGAAGKLFKGLLGIAKDVVSQISGSSGDVEYSRYELPYCQCQEAFWSSPQHASSGRLEKPSTDADEVMLPADIVHNFPGYHELLSPTPSFSQRRSEPISLPRTPPIEPVQAANSHGGASIVSPSPLSPPPPPPPPPPTSSDIPPIAQISRQLTPAVSPSSGPDVLDALFSSDVATRQNVVVQQTGTGDIDSFFR